MSSKAPISVGILTYNREKYLRRALESVKDFDDIIIADGGSSDGTLDIAREYGATIIEQLSVKAPSSDPKHPIEDFSVERNHLLDHAKHDWFFWLDSDEYISEELHDELVAAASKHPSEHFAYNIRIARQNDDATITYRDWKPNYQIRFFNTKTEGSFHGKMHEKFTFDRSKYSVGTLKGLWFVPSKPLSFEEYKKVVEYRLGTLAGVRPPKTLAVMLKKGVLRPFVESCKIIARAVIMRLYNPWRECIPLSMEGNRLYSQWYLAKKNISLYFKQN